MLDFGLVGVRHGLPCHGIQGDASAASKVAPFHRFVIPSGFRPN
jgi:hypothetical protein